MTSLKVSQFELIEPDNPYDYTYIIYIVVFGNVVFVINLNNKIFPMKLNIESTLHRLILPVNK